MELEKPSVRGVCELTVRGRGVEFLRERPLPVGVVFQWNSPAGLKGYVSGAASGSRSLDGSPPRPPFFLLPFFLSIYLPTYLPIYRFLFYIEVLYVVS